MPAILCLTVIGSFGVLFRVLSLMMMLFTCNGCGRSVVNFNHNSVTSYIFFMNCYSLSMLSFVSERSSLPQSSA